MKQQTLLWPNAAAAAIIMLMHRVTRARTERGICIMHDGVHMLLYHACLPQLLSCCSTKAAELHLTKS
jgi:hypothetical protein